MMPRNINLLSLNDLNFIGDIQETGKTLKQNAKIKSILFSISLELIVLLMTLA